MSKLADRTSVMDRRSFPIQLRADVATDTDSTRHITGHAAIFNSRSEDLGGFVEIISPGAFSAAIGKSDIRALWNHNSDIVLGRTKSGTLTVREDERGLFVDIIPPDTQQARDLVASIERGDVDQMSFAFTVRASDWKEEGENWLRTITEVEQLYDVSPVTYPAYENTDVSARSLAAFDEEKTKRTNAVGADGSPVETRTEASASARERRMRMAMAVID